jgi:hypothetical protein
MIKQVENERKLQILFLPINLNYIMSYLLQHCSKTFRKMQLIIGHMKIHFQKLVVPCFYLWHGYWFMTTIIENRTLESRAYLCLRFMCKSCITFKQLSHQNLTQIQPTKISLPNYFGNAYSIHRFKKKKSQCFWLPLLDPQSCI